MEITLGNGSLYTYNLLDLQSGTPRCNKLSFQAILISPAAVTGRRPSSVQEGPLSYN